MKEIIITEKNKDQRLDKFLFRLLNNASNSFVYKMLRKKNITLNDKKSDGKDILKAGDSIKIWFSDETYDSFTKIDIKPKKSVKSEQSINVVYEDEDVIIINKPAGLLSQNADKDDVSVNDLLINYLLDKKPVIEYKYKNNTEEISDNTGEFILNYENIKAHVLVSNAFDGDSSLKVFGTKGIIVIPDYWKTGKGYYLVDGNRYELDEELISDFHYEIQHFSDCLNNKLLQSPIMNEEFSHNIIEITQ